MSARRPQNRMFNRNAFKLGLFSPNCSGGMAITTIPERWSASWDDNRTLARMADDAGIEFILPIARWIGYGGDTDFQGSVLETLTWAAGLLASTEKVTVFSTVHTAFTHPIVAAKQCATIDQIGHGRFGLNIVCGWNKPEYDMFGLPLPTEHGVRYAYGQEWWDIVRNVWTSERAFDYHGKYFNVQGVHGLPKPVGGSLPPILNAASSGEGRDFAVRNVDFLFTVLVDLERGAQDVQGIKQAARAAGRDVGVFTTSYVVCRPTEKEARDYHHWYAEENGDWEAVDRLMTLQGLHAKSFPPDALALFRTRFAGGHGVYPLIGTPDQIADEIERIHGAGFAGSTVSFVDYVKELPYFAEEVLPRLERKGLRLPVGQA